MSNAFQRAADLEMENDFKLGMPSTDEAHRIRRLTLMETITGGKGFRMPPKESAVRGNGKTRGEARREARERANAAVNETRPYQHMHSAARRRILDAEVAAAA